MKKEFIVERQGRAFVLYAGLLNMAHENGLKSIHTDLIQIPSEANKNVAICTAVVILEREGVERRYTGIGDAAPNNVAPAMVTCLIRMSETRAKARALRDAVNVGVAAFEELGEDDAHDGAPERGYHTPIRTQRRQESRPPTATVGVKPAAALSNGPITEAQEKAIRSLCKSKALDPDAYTTEHHGVGLVNLTEVQAGDVIRALSSLRIA